MIFANIESAIALAFLTRYPTAASAASLTEKRLAAFGARQDYSGKKPAAVLLARLRSEPVGTLDPVVPEGIRDAALAQIGILTALNSAIKNLDRSTGEKVDNHPDGELVRSFPRAGTISAARILAEWGDARTTAEIHDRASGKDHPHATRILARAWVRVMWRCWQNDAPYDPTLHGNARQQQVAA